MKDRLLTMCSHLGMAMASAAALGYIGWPGLWVAMHFMLWASLAGALLCAVSLILKAGLWLMPPDPTDPPNGGGEVIDLAECKSRLSA